MEYAALYAVWILDCFAFYPLWVHENWFSAQWVQNYCISYEFQYITTKYKIAAIKLILYWCLIYGHSI